MKEKQCGSSFSSFFLLFSPFLPAFLSFLPCLSQDQNMKLGDGQVYFNALIRARHNPHYVITLSTERGEIAVWNIFTMTPVRTLTGITQPRKLKVRGVRSDFVWHGKGACMLCGDLP